MMQLLDIDWTSVCAPEDATHIELSPVWGIDDHGWLTDDYDSAVDFDRGFDPGVYGPPAAWALYWRLRSGAARWIADLATQEQARSAARTLSAVTTLPVEEVS